jgi:hypothetical protein
MRAVSLRLVALLAAANLLPVVLVVYFVGRFGEDLPVYDEWDAFVQSTIGRRDAGAFGLAALFAQHNEHRIVFSRLLTLANAALFHWDRRVEMYSTALLLIFTAAVLFGFLKTYWSNRWAALFFIPVAWTMLNWRQWANLLRAFQTQIGFVVAGTVLTFFLLQKVRNAGKYLWLAAAVGFMATFSFGAGLLVWPLGFVPLLLRQAWSPPEDRPRRASLAIWSVAGILAWAVYFIGYRPVSSPWPHGLAYVLQHPLEAAEYSLMLLGAPLSSQMQTARAIGALIAILAAYAVLSLARLSKTHLAAAGFLISLVIFTLLWAAALCLGRLGVGLEEALSSRYCSVTAVGLVAVYAILVQLSLIQRHPAGLLAAGGMLTLLMVGDMASFAGWFHVLPGYLDVIRTGKYGVLNAEVVNDAALRPIQEPAMVRRGIPILRRHAYSLFHKPLPFGLSAGPIHACAIDEINGTLANPLELSRQTHLEIRVKGWAIDAPAGQLPDRVFLSLDERIEFPALLGIPRPDVAAALHNDHYQYSGLTIYPRALFIPDGDHVLSLKIVSHDGSRYWMCTPNPPRVLRIVDQAHLY